MINFFKSSQCIITTVYAFASMCGKQECVMIWVKGLEIYDTVINCIMLAEISIRCFMPCLYLFCKIISCAFLSKEMSSLPQTCGIPIFEFELVNQPITRLKIYPCTLESHGRLTSNVYKLTKFASSALLWSMHGQILEAADRPVNLPV